MRFHPRLVHALVLMSVSLGAHAAPPSSVATPRQPGAAELLRSFDRLSVLGSVMYVAAHPDDENTGLLAFFANDALLRTVYLSLTRGEGGQNLIGAERAPWLGVIRTQELLAARGVDGAEQLFGMERDFGFSKTPDETLRVWGREAALGDVVFAIRRFRPDVIITGFNPNGGRETHGHHTASAILALEAFSKAGDPTAYPEQLAYVQPWQPTRVVWNRRSFQEKVTGPIHVDANAFNPVLGVSYDEVAATSRSMHKSQGFGDSPDLGPQLTHFQLLGGAPMQQSIFEGVDQTWARVPGAQKLAAALEKARGAFQPTKPAASLPALAEALGLLDALPDSPWKTTKREELVALMLACSGVAFEATAASAVAVPGRPVEVTLAAHNRAGAPLSLVAVRWPGGEEKVGSALTREAVWQRKQSLVLDAATRPSAPYWLGLPPTEGRWATAEPALTGLPEEPQPLWADFVFSLAGKEVVAKRAVTYRWTDPVLGDRRRGLEVLPPVTVTPAAPVMTFPDGKPKALTLTVRPSAGAASGAVRLEVRGGFTVSPPSAPFTLKDGEAEATLTFTLTPPAQKLAEGASLSGQVAVWVKVGEAAEAPALSPVRISYPHIPAQTATVKSEVKLVRFELKRPAVRIAYVPGAGDEVAEALREVGYAVTALGPAQLDAQALKAFDVVVLGVRAFNVSPQLSAKQPVLLDWVAAGGTLLVQYNTNNRIAALTGALGPFPFSISRDRVTEEDAAVTLKSPKDPLFTRPNVLGPADFEGWVQERGLYFAGSWDPKYAAPLSMHDDGEPPREGALLVAKHGKGTFIYTGLAFFRQLPAGVPGAFRLFSNLLATHGT